MTEKDPIRSEAELAEAFDQLFNDIPSPQTQEEIEEYIRDAGFDPNYFSKKIKELVTEAIQKSPLNWRNDTNSEKLVKARTHLESIRNFSELDHSKLISIVEDVFTQIRNANPKFAPVHYRNHSELSDIDLQSLLQELIFIAENEDIHLNIGD
jgi:hypothetical protein